MSTNPLFKQFVWQVFVMNSFFLYNKNMDTSYISNLVQSQRDFFSTGKTKDINFRKQKLIDLRNAIKKNEKRIT